MAGTSRRRSGFRANGSDRRTEPRAIVAVDPAAPRHEGGHRQQRYGIPPRARYPRLGFGRCRARPRLQPGIELGDVIADAPAMPAKDRSATRPAHALQGPRGITHVRSGLPRRQERASLFRICRAREFVIHVRPRRSGSGRDEPVASIAPSVSAAATIGGWRKPGLGFRHPLPWGAEGRCG